MSLFWLGVAGLLALTVWMLGTSRAGGGMQGCSEPSSTSSLGLLKHESAQLDAELAAGQLSAQQHRAARDELQRRVLSEAPRTGQPLHPGDPRRTWLLASLAVPLFALLLYGSLGNLAGLRPVPAAPVEDEQAKAVSTMVDTLAHRLATEPALAGDVSAWTMLARAYAGMQRFADASRAYARATALTPNDPQLLADHADVLALLQGGRLAGEPQQLIERALRIDPANLKALALAGSAAFERQDSAAALGFWQQARQRAPEGSAFASGLDRSLAALQPQPAAAPTAAAGPARISGHASLAPALASRIAAGDTVFITARAVDGPRLPLAVLRRTAGELPFDFSLDDSMAMSPEASLSKYPRVVLSARVSRSGNAMPQSGDLYGQAGAEAGSGRSVAITIDTVQP